MSIMNNILVEIEEMEASLVTIIEEFEFGASQAITKADLQILLSDAVNLKTSYRHIPEIATRLDALIKKINKEKENVCHLAANETSEDITADDID